MTTPSLQSYLAPRFAALDPDLVFRFPVVFTRCLQSWVFQWARVHSVAPKRLPRHIDTVHDLCRNHDPATVRVTANLLLLIAGVSKGAASLEEAEHEVDAQLCEALYRRKYGSVRGFVRQVTRFPEAEHVRTVSNRIKSTETPLP